MILVGTCVSGDGTKYKRYALPSLGKVLGPTDVILGIPGDAGIAKAYNQLILKARDLPGCQALVLLHDDVEILDPNFRPKALAAVADQDVGVAGVIGGSDLTSAEWYVARRKVGRVHETRFAIDFGSTRGDVDVVDGLLMVLAPRAFWSLTFDEEACPAYHGYDTDYCLAARSAGLRVIVAPIDVLHRTKGGYGDKDAFDKTAAVLEAKWSAFIRPLSPMEKLRRKATRMRETVRRVTRVPARVRRYLAARSSPPGSRSCAEADSPLDQGERPTCPVCGWLAEEVHSSPQLVVCPDCGTGITWPPPRRDVTGSDIWTERYGKTRLARRATWFREAELRLEWLLLYQPSGCILELGCGTGEFVRVCEDAGFDAYGVEPSAWAAAQARALGIGVETGFLADWMEHYPGLRPDVVTMWHVLEHCPDPGPILSKIRDVLRPGGLLMLEVPNFGSSAASELGLQWDAAQPDDHFFHYTTQSLVRLLDAVGFKVLHAFPITRRLYVTREAWQQERNEALVAGHAWPPLDLLRAVAYQV